jgi:hypothetical protein
LNLDHKFEEIWLHYQQAVEKVLPRIPVKNGLIDINSLWIETSLPYDLLQAIIRENKIILPANVERINSNCPGKEKEEKDDR